MAKFLQLVSGIPKMVSESASLPIYDEYYTVPSPITAGTAITLPASGSYTADELEVYLNGQRVDVVIDYNYVGSPARTQISFTFDLNIGEIVRFRIDRMP